METNSVLPQVRPLPEYIASYFKLRNIEFTHSQDTDNPYWYYADDYLEITFRHNENTGWTMEIEGIEICIQRIFFSDRLPENAQVFELYMAINGLNTLFSAPGQNSPICTIDEVSPRCKFIFDFSGNRMTIYEYNKMIKAKSFFESIGYVTQIK